MLDPLRPLRKAGVLGFCLMLLLAGALRADAQNRMPPIAPDNLSEEQRKEQQVFKAARAVFGQNITNDVTGPFLVLIRSPKLMNRVRGVGDYVRWETKSLSPLVNEFIAIITAREWTQPFVWNAHYPQALDHGMSNDTGLAVWEGRRPKNMSEEEEIAYDFITELHRNHSISDATYARALAKFGEQGVVDMIGVTGYYTFLSMSQNMARVPAPANATAPGLVALPTWASRASEAK